jgi:hypothetical protein
MPDFPHAIGQAVREEPAEQLPAVELGGAWAGTAHLPGGAGDRAGRAAEERAVGDGDLEDIRGQGGDGRLAMWSGLTMDSPRASPHLRGKVLQPSSVAQVGFADGSVAGGQGVDGDKEGGAGGAPGGAVL